MSIGYSFQKSSIVEKRTSTIFSGNTVNNQGITYQERETVNSLSYYDMYRMYQLAPFVRAIVDRIVTRVVDVPIEIRPIIQKGKTKATPVQLKHIEKLNNLLFKKTNREFESFDSIQKKYLSDILIYDAGAIELVKDKNSNDTSGRDIVEVYSIPGQQIKHNVNAHGYYNLDEAYYQVNDYNNKVATFAMNDLIYFMNHPQSDSYYGLSPLESLNMTVAAELYSTQYNMDFFANNATPRLALLFEDLGFTAKESIERAKLYWNNELAGKPHAPIIMGTEKGKITLQDFRVANKDMEFQAYSEWLLMKKMAVYAMQPFVLGVILATTGKLNSEQQTEQFKIDAIKPQLTLFGRNFNQEVVWNENGFNYNDCYLGHIFDVKDQKQTAEVNEKRIRAGYVTINEVRLEAGMEPVEWGDVPYMQNNVSPFGVGGMNITPGANVPTGLEQEPEGTQKNWYIKALNKHRSLQSKFYMEVLEHVPKRY